MVNCDYRFRATIPEVLSFLVDMPPDVGGSVLPQDILNPEAEDESNEDDLGERGTGSIPPKFDNGGKRPPRAGAGGPPGASKKKGKTGLTSGAMADMADMMGHDVHDTPDDIHGDMGGGGAGGMPGGMEQS